ncbi:MAG: HAMP domain-containing protein [Candidatus Magnetomorum sp.]|nr:HAMP domain-containing protein [Candidatus Magnetomorum sp.]
MIAIFKNLKIGVKIFMGFIIVLLLLVLIAGVGLNSLHSVTNRIDNVDGTNKLTQMILSSRQQEKNFIIRKDPVCIKEVENINKKLIQQAKETQKNFKRDVDIQSMKEVITAGETYLKSFETYVAFANQKTSLLETMQNNARNALKECETIREQQKNELVKIKEDNLKNVQDKLSKADDANQMVKYMLEAKGYRMVMMEGNTSVLSQWQELNRQLFALATDLKNRFSNPANIQQANQVIANYRNYENAVLRFLKSNNPDDKTKMAQAATATMDAIVAIRQGQKKELEIVQNTFIQNLDDKMAKADDANRLIKRFLAARQAEKNFLISEDKKYHLDVEKNIKTMIELCQDLKSRFKNKNNIDKVETIITGIEHYYTSFEELFEMIEKQKVAMTNMVDAARNAQKTTNNVQQGQYEQMESQVTAANSMAITFTLIAIGLGLFFSWFIARSISHPVSKIVAFIERIRAGDVLTLDVDSKDEIGIMSEGLNQMVTETQKLINNLENLPTPLMEIDRDYTILYINKAGRELLNLPQSDIVGKKCYSFFKTSHCQTAECCCHKAMNMDQVCTADTIADPTGLDLPIRYTGSPVKDLKGNIVGAIEFVLDVSGERKINQAIVKMINSINNGDFSMRGDASQFTGNYADLVNNVNKIVDAFVTPLKRIQEYVAKISRGEIPEPITEQAKGDFEILNNNLNMCIDAVNRLVKDAKQLVQASLDGKLDTRADVSRHQGDFAEVVKGINDTLDAILLPIKDAQDILENISNGVLTKFVTGEYRGDHAIIKNAINNTLSSLNDILNQVGEVSDNVAASANQLTSASHNLSEGAQQQAASVEEITASVHQTDQQIKQNADNADMANQLVSETNQAATTGQGEMQQLSKAMEEIFEASQNISKIIKVIDEIAFQTNILALNAAVEAARAGQHGKGFAVVAQEVRNLAGRSAQAAKETAEMIEGSNKKVNEGVNFAGRTEEALTKIVDNVMKVKDLVAEIATASKEQTHAMGQINEGMGQINTAVQNISSQSEETASAATELTSQSEDLKSQLAKFQLIKNEKMSGRGPEMKKVPVKAPSQKLIAKNYPHRKSPKDILPLDTDERGFGEF